jgi:prepilin-type N-terminal cleavage/methylation domain-containing protein
MKSRAFTLIELLVVIAIIAILAAILFPVFAQAKAAAKKTATLAQFKQVGTATAIYENDSDDHFPLAFSYDNTNGFWRAAYYHATPVGAVTSGNPPRNSPQRMSEESVFVLNALQPYIKSWGMYAGNGLADYNPTSLFNTAVTPAHVNLTFNGLLHAYSATNMARPSSVPLYWSGRFKGNDVGESLSNPQLSCDGGGQDCLFNPTGYPNSNGASVNPGYGYYWFGATNGAAMSIFVYGKGIPYVFSDTSAKFQNYGNLPFWPQYASNVGTPWSAMDPAGPDGAPYWSVDCVAPGGTKGSMPFYWGFFRPDNDGSFTIANCDAGGG